MARIGADRRVGGFPLLGCASGELLRQSSESLAGHIAYHEITPLLAAELTLTGPVDVEELWLRGVFPRSWLADGDEAETLRRSWRMLAHLHWTAD